MFKFGLKNLLIRKPFIFFCPPNPPTTPSEGMFSLHVRPLAPQRSTYNFDVFLIPPSGTMMWWSIGFLFASLPIPALTALPFPALDVVSLCGTCTIHLLSSLFCFANVTFWGVLTMPHLPIGIFFSTPSCLNMDDLFIFSCRGFVKS